MSPSRQNRKEENKKIQERK